MLLTTKLLSLKDILQYKRVYFEILSNLTQAPMIESNDIAEIYTKATLQWSHFIGCFDSSWDLVGLATLLIEQKFIREWGKVWHIEDVVTRKGYEGRGVGSTIIQACLKLAEEQQCYKVILDCNESNIPFYEKNGFKVYDICMRKNLTH